MHAGNGMPAAVPQSDASRLYNELRERLLRCLDELDAISAVASADCHELKERLSSNIFNLVVVGQFKRGKTCLINALLGADLLPVAVVPLTSIVTILTYGQSLRIEVIYHDGRTNLIGPEELIDYVTETGNPKNIRGVSEVVVQYPSSYLREGVRLIDTPGVGSVYRHNTDVAYHYLPKSDAALFLLSVEQPASQAELDFLRDVRQYADRIFFLLNKIDYLSEQDLEQSIDFSRAVIEEALGSNVKLFPISAKMALEGQLTGKQDMLRQSRLPGFAELLQGFLVKEKGAILLSSVIGHLMRLISQARCHLELEHRALGTSMEDLRAHIAAFDRKRKEIVEDQRNLLVLLDEDVAKLVRTELDAELVKFRKELIGHMEARVEQWRQENRELPLEALNSALEAFISEELRLAFQGWRSQADERLAAGFEQISRGYLERINESIDSLMKFSSELFALSFEPVRVETSWIDSDNFQVWVKDDPVALELLANSVTVLLPRIVGNRFSRLKNFFVDFANRTIFGKAREQMSRMIDIHSGRTRYSFVERLNKSKDFFYKRTIAKLNLTITGLDNALDQGLQLRSQGEEQVVRQQSRLEGDLRRIDGVYQNLLDIRNALPSSDSEDQAAVGSSRVS